MWLEHLAPVNVQTPSGSILLQFLLKRYNNIFRFPYFFDSITLFTAIRILSRSNFVS